MSDFDRNTRNTTLAFFLAMLCMVIVVVTSYRAPVPEKLPDVPQSLLPHTDARSGHWPKVRADHLDKEPVCAVCGSKLDLQVHHVEPFHLHPEKELDPDNLITLCGPGGHNCHFVFGHLMNYKSWNVHVREDAKVWNKKLKNRP